ncbi:MAG TPA: TonB-dependent receptor [Micropepsaceae bacterium]|nr:TonB-dependent receptor [Micropepsaceae bacterium]
MIRAFTAHGPVRGARRTLFAIARGLALSSLCGTATGNAADGNEDRTAKEFLAISEGSPEVVYVTARRRTERAQDVPISLTAVSGYTLEANGVSNVLKLNQFVPTLQVFSFNPRNTSITIRGLGANIAITNDGIEPGVGVYVDGVLQARPAEAIFDLPDIASVEVLRGPQGTLYGKNSVAGAVNINTLRPGPTFEAYGRISFGDFGYKQFSGTVSGPVDANGKLSAGLSALYTDRGGFFKDVFNGKRLENYRDYSVRGQLLYQPTGDFSLRVIADYAYYNSLRPVRAISGVVTTLANGQALPRNFYQRAAAAGYTPLPIDPYARLTDANTPIYSKMAQGGGSAEANWNVGGVLLTSISSYRSWKWRPSNDDDLTSLAVMAKAQQQNDDRQVTQELRVASTLGRAVEFSGGLYYFWEQIDGLGQLQYGPDAPIWILGSTSPVSKAALDGFTISATSVPRINSYAGYGQATWHISPDVDLTGGARYTYEYKTGGYAQTVAGASVSGFTSAEQATIQATRALFGTANNYSVRTSNNLLGGLATLAYHVTDGVMTYATYSHGEKSAGLNLANLAIAVPKIVAPESVDNYEIGFKSSLPDERLTFNADLFWTDDTNYQTTLLDTSNFVIYLANIPAVRSRGLEADVTARPFEGLSTYLSAAYIDATYVSYPNAPAPFEAYTVVAGRLNTNITVDLSNRPLPAVSKWAFSLGGEYSQNLGDSGLGNIAGYLGIDESYRSGYFTNTSLSIYSRVPSYDLTNVRVGLRTSDGRWDVQVWARNLFDRKYKISQVPLVFNSGALSALLGDPRTIGVTFGARF